MKKHVLITLASLSAVTSAFAAFDFSYGYKTVYDANADQYIIGTSNVRKYSEWQSPPVTYWGPTANNVTGLLTMRFDFATPTTLINLRADLAAYNLAPYGAGSGSGSSSLWASTDGSSWSLLMDNPTPSAVDSYKTYDQNVPANLLGTTSFYLQSRFLVQGAPNSSYTDAQFSRSATNRTGNVFQLNANISPVPEPTTILFGVGLSIAGFVSLACKSKRKLNLEK